MKFGVISFPGSNCDDDMIYVFSEVMGAEVKKIWHKEDNLGEIGLEDGIIIPGGFSYGDYLRSGAIAKFSPIMKAVIAHANAGGFVWGICNGFQILCEAGLLPGVLLRNERQKFIGKDIFLRVEQTKSRISNAYEKAAVLKIPIAHADGRYYVDADTLSSMNKNEQIIFRYSDAAGDVSKISNPNGSLENIAGICNVKGNVYGMMPHPERAAETLIGNTDGLKMFVSLLQNADKQTVEA